MLEGHGHIAERTAVALAGGTLAVRDPVEIAVQDYVRVSGHRVIGTGSWVTGEGYRCPLYAPDFGPRQHCPLRTVFEQGPAGLTGWPRGRDL